MALWGKLSNSLKLKHYCQTVILHMIQRHFPTCANKRIGCEIDKVIWFVFFDYMIGALWITNIKVNKFKAWVCDMANVLMIGYA